MPANLYLQNLYCSNNCAVKYINEQKKAISILCNLPIVFEKNFWIQIKYLLDVMAQRYIFSQLEMPQIFDRSMQMYKKAYTMNNERCHFVHCIIRQKLRSADKKGQINIIKDQQGGKI